MAVRLIDPAAELRLVALVEPAPGLKFAAPQSASSLGPELAGLIPLAALADPAAWRVVVAAQRPDLGPDGGCGNGTLPLSGGYALMAGGELLIEPECCGTLGDLASWRGAAGLRAAEWQEFWIGHPCMLGRYAGGQVWLSPGHEPDAQPRAPGPDAVVFRVAAAALAAATVRAAAALDAFALQLETALYGPSAAAAARPGVVRALLGRDPGLPG